MNEFLPAERVICIAASSGEERTRNIKSALAMNLKRFEPRKISRTNPLTIIGGGPSLDQTYRGIMGDTMVCGSAHDHVIGLGIKPTYVAECDPCEEQIIYYKGKSNAQYLVASRCNENMFKHLYGRDIRLWHLCEEGIDYSLLHHENIYRGGSTIFLSSVTLAMVMGYRKLIFHGIDSSFPDYSRHHAYACPEDASVVTVRVGDPVTGKEFKTTPTWMSQATEYQQMASIFNFKGYFCGNGMLAEMERCAGRQHDA